MSKFQKKPTNIEPSEQALVKVLTPEYMAYSLVKLNGKYSVVRVPADLSLCDVLSSHDDVYVAQEAFKITIENELF